MSVKKKQWLVTIPSGTHRELKQEAARSCRKLCDVVKDAMELYLDKVRASKGSDQFEEK